jgi:hypothetical protein
MISSAAAVGSMRMTHERPSDCLAASKRQEIRRSEGQGDRDIVRPHLSEAHRGSEGLATLRQSGGRRAAKARSLRREGPELAWRQLPDTRLHWPRASRREAQARATVMAEGLPLLAVSMSPGGDLHNDSLRPSLRPTLDAFERALGREAHNLARRPDLTWQQLYNRLQWAVEAVRERLEPEREHRSTLGAAPWLRTRTRFRESEALVRVLTGHTGDVVACAFSPDGPFFRNRSPGQILAAATPWTSPWLPQGYEQNFCNAALHGGCTVRRCDGGRIACPPARSYRSRRFLYAGACSNSPRRFRFPDDSPFPPWKGLPPSDVLLVLPVEFVSAFRVSALLRKRNINWKPPGLLAQG